MPSLRCKLVGRRYHNTMPLTPDDVIQLERVEFENEPAFRVSVVLPEGYSIVVGYVDRQSAAKLAKQEVCAARVVTQGDGHEVPLSVEIEK